MPFFFDLSTYIKQSIFVIQLTVKRSNKITEQL